MESACVLCLRIKGVQSIRVYEARLSTHLRADEDFHTVVTSTGVRYEYEYSYVRIPPRTQRTVADGYKAIY